MTREELVAIYTALDKFATYEWMGIFTDFLSNLHAIRHSDTHQGPISPENYHLHQLLLIGITDLLEERRRRGFRTTLHNIRAHTNIRGNDLANPATKMTVTQYESLPKSQKLKVDVGEVAPRPPQWVMYTMKPPPLPYTVKDIYTDGYVALTVVVDSGRGAFTDARFYAPLATTPT